MLELTMIVLAVTFIFYILRIIFKDRNEFIYMSIIMSVIGLACVLKDTEIEGDNLILFIVPLFYIILMSALSLYPSGGKK